MQHVKTTCWRITSEIFREVISPLSIVVQCLPSSINVLKYRSRALSQDPNRNSLNSIFEFLQFS